MEIITTRSGIRVEITEDISTRGTKAYSCYIPEHDIYFSAMRPDVNLNMVKSKADIMVQMKLEYEEMDKGID